MPKLTAIPPDDFEKFLLSVGCRFDRQKGSHKIYKKSGLLRPLVVPQYDTVPVFILKNNLRLLDISNEEFLERLKDL